jgi:hypothetical protein
MQRVLHMAFVSVQNRLRGSSATEVLLNQPGRALTRCILWSMTGLALLFLPLGYIFWQLSKIDFLSGFCGEMAGILLSGAFSELLIVLVLAAQLAWPWFRSSEVPPPILPVRDAQP